MFASIDGNLVSGAIPVIGLAVYGAVARTVKNRRTKAHEPSQRDHEMLLRHDVAIKQLTDAIVGTEDILGRHVPGIADKVDELLTLTKNGGNGRGHA